MLARKRCPSRCGRNQTVFDIMASAPSIAEAHAQQHAANLANATATMAGAHLFSLRWHVPTGLVPGCLLAHWWAVCLDSGWAQGLIDTSASSFAMSSKSLHWWARRCVGRSAPHWGGPCPCLALLPRASLLHPAPLHAQELPLWPWHWVAHQ